MTKIDHQLDIKIPGLDKQLIAGQWTDPSPAEYPVISPSTEQVIANTCAVTIEDAERAVLSARKAFDSGSWSNLSIEQRVIHCSKLCDAIESRLGDLNRAWALESGPTLSHAEIINNNVGVTIWRRMLNTAVELDWSEHRDDVLLLREPIGTVLSIMTFNGPIVLMAMKIIPAMLAGCTVIGKHAPESQLTSRLLSEAIEEADIPPGVLTLLPAGTEVTQHLVSHSGIDMVSLTGGTQIGIEVIKRTADRLARTTLELGGKSPAIILEDANIAETIDTLVPGSTAYMGQVCVSLSRILVPTERYAELIEALEEKYSTFILGDPLDAGVDQGPIATERGLLRAERAVETAKQQGARVVAGGGRPTELEQGWWYQPTLLDNVNNSMDIAQVEVFGPVTAVIPYSGVEEAIKLANDSDFGLAASIYGTDSGECMRVAKRLQSGSVAINTAGISFLQPFGGYKKSGWGRECGPEGILEFTQIKQVIGS